MKKNNNYKILKLILVCGISAAILAFTIRSFSMGMQSFNQLQASMPYKSKLTLSTEHLYQYEKPVLEDSNDYSDYYYHYEKEGIEFLSEVELWNDDRLELISDELFTVVHGEEISLIKSVIVSSEPDKELSSALVPSANIYSIPLYLNEFFPNGIVYNVKYNKNSIYLYGFDSSTEIDDFVFELNHAYGEHFVQYYLQLTGTDADKESEYYKLRAQNYSQVITDMSKFDGSETNAKWCLSEIAVNDYIFFMGSKTTKEVYIFIDSRAKTERYYNRNKNVDNPYYKKCRNGTPHINVVMALPNEAEGLADYFYDFLGQEPPQYSIIEPVGTLNLRMSLVGSNQHYFTWDQPYNEPGTYYTLIGYDMDDNTEVMVVTYDNSETGTAQLGRYNTAATKYTPGADSHIFFYDAGAQMKFRLSITFPDGTVVMSDPIVITY